MKERPQFEKVRDTPYGPELRRKRYQELETPAPQELPELNKIQRINLRTALVALGIGVLPMKSDKADYVPAPTYETSDSQPDESVVAEEMPVEAQLEEDETFTTPTPEIFETLKDYAVNEQAIEESIQSEQFTQEVEGYKTQVQLRHDEILFVDAYNQPIGEPQPFADYVDAKLAADGSVQMEQYLFTPGPVNEVGVLETGVPGEWMDYVQQHVQAKYPDREVDHRVSVIPQFHAVLENFDEPELIAAIANGEVTSQLDIIQYFADKPVVGVESMTRQEYVQNAIEFTPWDEEAHTGVPSVVQAELRRLVVGLCAQESGFNAAVTSPAGAKGIFQFMEATWVDEYGAPLDEIRSLTKQVEVAGQFFSDLYVQVQYHAGEEAIATLQNQFADTESFQRDLLVPLMLNSYNAGAARIGAAVQEYIAHTPVENLPAGKDVFLSIVDFAAASDEGLLDRFGSDARSYVPRIYAQADLLNAPLRHDENFRQAELTD